MKKITLCALFFVFSVSANAAPTLTWSSATPGLRADAVESFGMHHEVNPNGDLSAGDTVTLGAFNHFWSFSSDGAGMLDSFVVSATAGVGAVTGITAFLTRRDDWNFNPLDEISRTETSVSNPFFPIGPSSGTLVENTLFSNTDISLGDYVLVISANASALISSYNFTLGSSDSAGTVAATPLPAAAWLFISAILGVGGLASRRKTLPVDGLAA
ncbi:MAG: VPLPA-CTERM sorting domain-containing protein [Methylococcaceae bacterium]|nr:VPLPA-CTERM sorting domain-containing protein [Methylococcaceae bacterium]